MYKNKKLLLIAGGGTLGTYAAKELLELGAYVEIICPEEKVSDHPRLSFHQGLGTVEFLEKLFANHYYDGIVNFIHYTDVEEYKAVHPLLTAHTDHLIFLSSYRVYADEQHPITESAPRLWDVSCDEEFLSTEDYAVPKAKCEDYLFNECGGQHWSIVRPVISFSERRLDLLMYSGKEVLNYAARGEEMLLPETVRHYRAGIDWAGNTGKLIARLLFKSEAYGEAFTVYSGHGLTWGEVAEIYQRLIGLSVRWCDEKEFEALPKIQRHRWMWVYDRKFDRDIDPEKILSVTGLSADDFASVEEGLKTECHV